MVVVLSVVLLVLALGVFRAAAKERITALRSELDEAWLAVEDARRIRRAPVAELVPLLMAREDLEPRHKRVVGDLRRELQAAAKPVSAGAVGRVEQRLMDAFRAAVVVASERPELAETARTLRAEVDEAGVWLAEVASEWNRRARRVSQTASTFPASLVGIETEEARLDLGYEEENARGNVRHPVRSR